MFEWLHHKRAFQGRVAAFGAWLGEGDVGAVGDGEAATVQPGKSGVFDGRLVEVDHRFAIGFLIARIDERVK